MACTWPALLTYEEAEAIRHRRAKRQYTRASSLRSSLLTGMGLLRCGYCGGRVTGQTSGARSYYGCIEGVWRDNCRRSRLVRQEVVDRAVVAAVLGVLSDPGHLRAAWRASAAELGDQERRLDDAAAEVEAKRRRLVDAIAAGVIDLQDARETMGKLREAEAAIAREQAAAAPALQEPDWPELSRLSAAWERFDRDERRSLLGAMVEQVSLTTRGGQIRLLLPLSEAGQRSLPLVWRMVK